MSLDIVVFVPWASDICELNARLGSSNTISLTSFGTGISLSLHPPEISAPKSISSDIAASFHVYEVEGRGASLR